MRFAETSIFLLEWLSNYSNARISHRSYLSHSASKEGNVIFVYFSILRMQSTTYFFNRDLLTYFKSVFHVFSLGILYCFCRVNFQYLGLFLMYSFYEVQSSLGTSVFLHIECWATLLCVNSCGCVLIKMDLRHSISP